jgi:DNA-binding GntR family transcriptional regulator
MKPIEADRESLAAKVSRTIRDAIITGELVPGTRHSVHELAQLMQVSRTPVRESLIGLADQGMVRFERNRGVVILPTTVHDLEEVFSLRLLLEVPATYRATTLISSVELTRLRNALNAMRGETTATPTRERLVRDAKFHGVIMQASGNNRLAGFVDTLRDIQMVRGASTAGKTRTTEAIFAEHLAIFERVEARDADGAAAAMREHIADSAKLLLAQETGDLGPGVSVELPWMELVGRLNGKDGDG